MAMDEDYPRTLLELERRFGSEEAGAEYLAVLRWHGGCSIVWLSRPCR